MTLKEEAYEIIEKFGENELRAFITLFQKDSVPQLENTDKVKGIYTICDCLELMGSKEPFLYDNRVTEELSKSGNKAFNQLRSLIFYLVREKVVDKFNEDRLDCLVNEKGY